MLQNVLSAVVEINRIHHWCPGGTEKSQPKAPRSSGKQGLPIFPLNDGPEGWNVSGTTEHQWSILFLIYQTVRYSIISVGDVTEFVVYSQWRALYKSTWNSEQTAH